MTAKWLSYKMMAANKGYGLISTGNRKPRPTLPEMYQVRRVQYYVEMQCDSNTFKSGLLLALFAEGTM